MRIKLKRLVPASILFTMLLMFSLFAGVSHSVRADPNLTGMRPVYDISQWQGDVSNSQASQLKNEVSFMILKAENGGLYTDPDFIHNASEMNRHGIPYGAYDYSVYANDAQAAGEARALYRRAPGARFYINDAEENDAGSDFDSATSTWANEMHRLTRKPVILYSDLAFMNRIAPQSRNRYDGLWLADYGSEPDPDYHYDLWQYSDDHYSNALNQNLDASTFPDNSNKSMAFWLGHKSSKRPVPENSGNYNSKAVVSDSGLPILNDNGQLQAPQVNPVHHHHRRIRFNHKYYCSKRVNYVRVIARHGIGLYTLNHKYIGHVHRGTVLLVNRFKRFYRHHGRYYYNRAVGYHEGYEDLFTANKRKVRWYRYY